MKKHEENRYKRVRQDFEYTKGGYKMTQQKLAQVFKKRGYGTLNESAIKKIETDRRTVSEYERAGYCQVFNVTSDYLIGATEISSPNIDVISACRLTGLSENAIKNIGSLKDEEKQILELLFEKNGDCPTFFEFRGLLHDIYDFSVFLNAHTLDVNMSLQAETPVTAHEAVKRTVKRLSSLDFKTVLKQKLNARLSKLFNTISEKEVFKNINKEHFYDYISRDDSLPPVLSESIDADLPLSPNIYDTEKGE